MMKNRLMSKNTRKNLITYAMVTVAFVVMTILNSGGMLSNSLEGQLVPICAYIVMAISLNLTVGIMGELSLGHAGFMSVGAITGVVASTALAPFITNDAFRLFVTMFFGAIAAGIVSVIVVFPVLRLHGDYLAIVTLAFGQIIKNIVDIMYVGIDSNGIHFATGSADSIELAEGGVMVLQGAIGAVGYERISTFTAGFILVMFTIFISLNFINSRSGRAVMALRDNRIAAESVGISPSRYKSTAFIISGMLAGMAGVLFSLNYTTVVARKFDFNTSILILMFVVLGGIGNIRGSIIAATVLTVLPEMLRGGLSDYRLLIYAVILILVMIATNNAYFHDRISDIKSIFKLPKKGKSDVR